MTLASDSTLTETWRTGFTLRGGVLTRVLYAKNSAAVLPLGAVLGHTTHTGLLLNTLALPSRTFVIIIAEGL